MARGRQEKGGRRKEEGGGRREHRLGFSAALRLLGIQLTCGLCRTRCLCCQHCGNSGEARRERGEVDIDRDVAEVEADATPS